MEKKNDTLLDIPSVNEAELPCEMPPPISLKDINLRCFITAGINKKDAEDFLTPREEGLPLDPPRSWIYRFLRDQHDLICEGRSELLTDPEGYFAALGFDRPPVVDPEIWHHETLFNVAWLHITDSLLDPVPRPIEDNATPDTWSLVSINSKRTSVAVYVTKEIGNVLQSDVQAQIKALKSLPDDVEFWYHATSSRDANIMAATNTALQSSTSYNDFNRSRSLYLNKDLRGDLSRCRKRLARNKPVAVLVFAIHPHWRDNTNLVLNDLNTWKDFVQYSRDWSIPGLPKPENYNSATVEGYICTNGGVVSINNASAVPDLNSWQLCLRTYESSHLFDTHLVGVILEV